MHQELLKTLMNLLIISFNMESLLDLKFQSKKTYFTFTHLNFGKIDTYKRVLILIIYIENENQVIKSHFHSFEVMLKSKLRYLN